MIDEQTLCGLADPGSGPPVASHLLDDVLARGDRLRRRRRAFRAAGAATVVAGMLATGIVIRTPDRAPAPDVRAAETPSDSTTATSDVPSPAPGPAPDGCGSMRAIGPEELAAADVPEDMRMLASWVPDEAPLTVARGSRYDDPCAAAVPYPVDEALTLEAGEASIRLQGPLPQPTDDNWSGIVATELRGGSAVRMDPSPQDDVAFGWTEPDGWSWELMGYGVDEPTLRAVAEALQLDSSPEGEEPTAALPAEAVPAGFEVTWQTLGVPAAVPPVTETWTVQYGESQAVQMGTLCHLEVRPRQTNVPFSQYGSPDAEHLTIGGHDAVWDTFLTEPAQALTWQVTPDVIAMAGCNYWDESGMHPLSRETVVRFAESVAPVAADDPRLPS